MSIQHGGTVAATCWRTPTFTDGPAAVAAGSRASGTRLWAEIEHDLGYKPEDALARPNRRRFSRLAGLLEIADDEFVSLRESKSEYSDAVPGQIADSKLDLKVDSVTIAGFLRVSNDALELDRAVVAALEAAPELLVEEVEAKFARFVQKNFLS